MSKQPFTLIWHRTYTDYPHDYSGFDEDILVGRIYRFNGGLLEGKWLWSLTVIVGKQTASAKGVADDREAARMAVKERYRQSHDKTRDK